VALAAAGFTVVKLETEDVWLRSNPAIIELLKEVNLSTDNRGDNIFALARKTSAPIERSRRNSTLTDKKDKDTGRKGEREKRRRGEGGNRSDERSAFIEWEDDEITGGDLVSPLHPFTPSPTPQLTTSPALKITIPMEAEDQRLDLFLTSRFSETSRSAIQRAISGGDITVNGKIVKPSHRVRAGEEITGEIPAAPVIDATPEDIPLDIVYEDEEIIVVNKPAGMVTHPGAGATSGTLANGLVYYLNRIGRQPPRRGGSSRPGIVHRLDVGTSGLIVVAKTDRAHLNLAEQFESRSVMKEYIALVYGALKDDSGKIEAPIGRDQRNRVKMAVTRDGRRATTLYRVAERFDEFTLLNVEIKTGRTHQIRVHLAYIKHPVVADSTYGAGRANSIKSARLRAAVTRLDRPFLHATRLGFAHPVTGERMEFTIPLPGELRAFLEMVSTADKRRED
jgi:23S rRNA pseudouridine1911/1915/1917 synthase